MKAKTMKIAKTREHSGICELSDEDICTVNRVLLAVNQPKRTRYQRWLRCFRSVELELRLGTGGRRSGRDSPTTKNRLVAYP